MSSIKGSSSESADNSLLIRADASAQIGTGHVMRCLALAQAWQEAGATVQFALADATPTLEARLRDERIKVRHLATLPGSADDAVQTTRLAQELRATWVVIDGYHFSAAYQQAVKQADLRLLFIDDYGHANHYYADLVLNQNISANESLYANCETHTRLLLGTRYALLRREFWPWRGWRREIPSVVRKVLVTLGGSDPDNVTLKVIKALQEIQMADLEAVVVAGGSNPYADTLKSRVTELSYSARLVENAPDMPKLMAWADIAVSAGGSTCWELAFMGLPHLILILAENQRLIAEKLHQAGAAVSLGWSQDVDSALIADAVARSLADTEALAEMSWRGQQLVDGEGGHRVVAEMLAEASIHVRPVAIDDIHLLFLWSNDPLTRQMSFNSDPITWEDHQRWFNRILNSPEASLMIVELREHGGWIPIGQIRIDHEGVVSISLSSPYRGRYLAEPALRKAISYHGACFPQQILTAYVKPENELSRRIFIRVGFEFAGRSEIHGQPCLKYIYQMPGDQNDDSSSKGDRLVQDS